MTISSTAGTDMTVDEVCKAALQTAAIVGMGRTPTSDQMDWCRKALNRIVNQLVTEGVQARWVDFYNLALTAGDYTYSLPATVIDVVGDGMYIDASQSDTSAASGETVVKQMDREQWHSTSDKSAQSRPYRFFADRAVDGNQIEVKLWPTPDEAGTIRFQVHSTPADSLTGSATLDLREYWMSYLVWALAHESAVASGLPAAHCSMLNKRAGEFKLSARQYANQKPANRRVLNHPTGWNRSR